MNWFKKQVEKLVSKKNRFLVRKFVKNLEKSKLKTIKNPSNLIKNQIFKPNSIPVIIINFNQLFYLVQLIDFLLLKKTENIIIVDNCSTYLPLLNYYKKISNNKNITIEIQNENLGHLVFWRNRALYKKYSDGFFVITDADIVPNINLYDDYLKIMLDILIKNHQFTKVGFALNIDNIPEYYTLKQKVLNWESQYWNLEIEKNCYNADIDTTFALYWPNVDRIVKNTHPYFFKAIRMGGDFTALHGGWYLNNENMTDEQLFYLNTSNSSNSWKMDTNGKIKGDYTDIY